jgi:hypothetical protein
MKTLNRYHKRSAAQATLLTIVMMCLQEQSEICIDDCEVYVAITENCRCTVTAQLVMKQGAPIIWLCQQIQKHIAEEIATMTPFTVDAVNIVVKRLAI